MDSGVLESHIIWTLLFLMTLSKLTVTTPTKIIIFEKIYFHGVISISVFPSNETVIFQRLTLVSIQDCIDECKRLKVCEFINFHVRTHQCHIIQSDSSINVQVVSSPGYAYGIKTDWNLNEMVAGCSGCRDTERCEFETSPTTCDVEACGPPSPIPDTVMHGNVFRTGDTLLFECNDTKTMSNGGIFQTTCQNDGLWSSVNFTCTDESTTSCIPVESGTFQETLLSDNTEFAYLIITTKMSHSAALTYCQDRCGQLVEVLTLAKFTFLQNVLPGYGNTDYYIDGTYDSSTGKWMTSSGQELQHNYSMWSSNPAYFSSEQPCIRMRVGDQYKINTHQCSTKYRVICEQP